MKAFDYKPIRSSIPEAVKVATSAATSAQQAAASSEQSVQSSAKRSEETRKRLERVTRNWSVGAALTVVITVATGLYASWQLIQDTWTIASETRKQLHENIEGKGRENNEANVRLNEEIFTLKKQLATVADEVAALKKRPIASSKSADTSAIPHGNKTN